mmetsp:Transcript_13303/g.32579  ORF Transcript_13303/g.32579 Transcript_13303/m.32579 type:complete len:244 (+) Transcript_13303:3687-4418(+)
MAVHVAVLAVVLREASLLFVAPAAFLPFWSAWSSSTRCPFLLTASSSLLFDTSENAHKMLLASAVLCSGRSRSACATASRSRSRSRRASCSRPAKDAALWITTGGELLLLICALLNMLAMSCCRSRGVATFSSVAPLGTAEASFVLYKADADCPPTVAGLAADRPAISKSTGGATASIPCLAFAIMPLTSRMSAAAPVSKTSPAESADASLLEPRIPAGHVPAAENCSPDARSAALCFCSISG